MQVHICPTSNSRPQNRAAACDVGATNLTRNHSQRGPRMPSASPCANASAVSPLVRAAALAKTIMVLRNIVGTPFGTGGVHSTDKKSTIVRLDCENQIHAPPL